jgi:hypothetical protein
MFIEAVRNVNRKLPQHHRMGVGTRSCSCCAVRTGRGTTSQQQGKQLEIFEPCSKTQLNLYRLLPHWRWRVPLQSTRKDHEQDVLGKRVPATALQFNKRVRDSSTNSQPTYADTTTLSPRDCATTTSTEPQPERPGASCGVGSCTMLGARCRLHSRCSTALPFDQTLLGLA